MNHLRRALIKLPSLLNSGEKTVKKEKSVRSMESSCLLKLLYQTSSLSRVPMSTCEETLLFQTLLKNNLENVI